MASFGEILAEWLYGRYTPEPDDYLDQSSWRDVVLDLYDGNVSATARDLGVPRSTLRGWLAGRTPKRGREWVAERFSRRAKSEIAKVRAPRILAMSWDSVTFHGTFRYEDGGSMRGAEERHIPIGRYVNPAVNEALIAAAERGAGPEDLQRVFADHITDNGFYEQTIRGDWGDWDITEVTGLD